MAGQALKTWPAPGQSRQGLKRDPSLADKQGMPRSIESTREPAATGVRALRERPTEIGGIVRQPILDPDGLIHGYELLLKINPQEELPAIDSNDVLTILDNLALFGLDRLTGGSLAFVNCTAAVLTEDLVAVLPPSLTVLEIPTSLEMSPLLLGVCSTLKRAGFRLALVDFTEDSRSHPLLKLSDYVKVDSSCLNASDYERVCRPVKGTAAAMMASGIHSQDSYRKAGAEGFKYFQGYYFCNPEPLPSAKIPANRLLHIEILRELFRDPLDLDTLCPLVLRDASLVYRVLRLVNSPIYAIHDPITSLEKAILILGDVAFRRIATLAIQCALNASRSREILHMALVRARFCADSACLCNLDANEQYLLGMLSMLPAMLSLSMERIVPELPLRHNVCQALLGSPVQERCLLDWIECHEHNDVKACAAIANRYGLDHRRLMQFYVDALAWGAADPGFTA